MCKHLVTIEDLSPEVIQKYSEAILRIASDVPGEYWRIDNFLLPLECKWALSFLVIIAGNPEGYVIASNLNGHTHIHHFMVSKQLRGQGVGSMMFEEIERRTKVFGVKKMSLKISKDNSKAKAFYQNHGFKVEKKDVGTGGGYLLMSMKLPGRRQ